MKFDEIVESILIETWKYGFPYEVKAMKNDAVVASRKIKNEVDLENAQNWFAQYGNQGCKFKKVLLGAI